MKQTIELIINTLRAPTQTWKRYTDEGHHWKETAKILTVPLILASQLLYFIISWIGDYDYAFRFGVLSVPYGIIMAFFTLWLSAFVFGKIGGFLGGSKNFSDAFNAVSFAFIPSALGTATGHPLIGLVTGVVTLVFLYKAMPIFLGIPSNKRVIHFILSFVVLVVVMFVVGTATEVGTAMSTDTNNIATQQGVQP